MGGWGKGAPAAVQFDTTAAAAAIRGGKGSSRSYGGKGKNGRGSMEKPADVLVRDFQGHAIGNFGLIGKEIGRGTFGRVFELPEHPKLVAKIMKTTSSYIHHSCDAMHEYEILKTIADNDTNKRCLSVVGCEQVESDFLAVIMEKLETNLFKCDKSTIDVRKATKSLLQQLKVMHSVEYIHTDIKHKNIMVTSKGDLKIIDFGSGVFPSDSRPETIVTKPFRPPEIYLKNNWDQSVDVWALAMTIGWLSADRKFFSINFGDIPRHLSSCSGSFSPFRPDMSSKTINSTLSIQDVVGDSKLSDLLHQMLHLDPSKRITAEDALSHSYYSRISPLKKESKITMKTLLWLSEISGRERLRKLAVEYRQVDSLVKYVALKNPGHKYLAMVASTPMEEVKIDDEIILESESNMIESESYTTATDTATWQVECTNNDNNIDAFRELTAYNNYYNKRQVSLADHKACLEKETEKAIKRFKKSSIFKQFLTKEEDIRTQQITLERNTRAALLRRYRSALPFLNPKKFEKVQNYNSEQESLLVWYGKFIKFEYKIRSSIELQCLTGLKRLFTIPSLLISEYALRKSIFNSWNHFIEDTISTRPRSLFNQNELSNLEESESTSRDCVSQDALLSMKSICASHIFRRLLVVSKQTVDYNINIRPPPDLENCLSGGDL